MSEVMTRLLFINHTITVTSKTPALTPYRMLSRVRGFPVGRYRRIVTPSWLKAGLNRAVRRKTGRHHFRQNNTARCPSACTA